MATAGRLDRRAKTALAALLLILLVIIAAGVRASVVAVAPDSLVAEAGPSSQDEIVQIGGHTLLLRRGSTGNKIANWLHAGSKGSRAFEVGERAFMPDSDALTSDGERRLVTFAQMMEQVPDLSARILVSTYKVDPQLARGRAQRLRGELVGHGVPASRIQVSPAPIVGGRALSKQPELVVVLSA